MVLSATKAALKEAPMSESERRLAAIMFTDMVGFTALGQRDEALALRLAEEHRKLIRPIVVRHNGREVKTMGDGLLMEFTSALEAVRCAYEIQRGMRELNISLPEGRRAEIRIGVHLGDVVESEPGDISGDAVNIASRIEPLAENGGVCITRQVYDQVRNKLDLRMDPLGAKQLKNVNSPVEIYEVVMPWKEGRRVPSPSSEKRRIAVLPFANMSPEAGDSYLADGMTEELITSLSGMRELMVIARTSVMRFRSSQKGVTEIAGELNVGTVIEGSVRRAGNRIRVTVQLIDAATEAHLWAQSYDRLLDDIFAVQSEIAGKVSKELAVHLLSSERERLDRKPTEDTEAYMLYLKGRHHWNERTDEGLLRAVSYFEKAVERDPKFALGYSGLADCYVVMGRNGPGSSDDNYSKGELFVAKALELDPDLAEAHAARAGILHYYRYNWEEADREYRRALELKPNYATGHQWYSHLLILRHRFAETTREADTAIKLDPLSLVVNHNKAADYYYQGKFEQAIEWFKRTNDLEPSILLGSVALIGLFQAYAVTGRIGEAAEELRMIENLPKKVRLLPFFRAYMLAITHKHEEACRAIQDIEAGYRSEHTSPYLIAVLYFVLGDADSGFKWLQTAYDEHDSGIAWMTMDYELAKVRKDPRYLALEKAIGLDDVSGR